MDFKLSFLDCEELAFVFPSSSQGSCGKIEISFCVWLIFALTDSSEFIFLLNLF